MLYLALATSLLLAPSTPGPAMDDGALQAVDVPIVITQASNPTAAGGDDIFPMPGGDITLSPPKEGEGMSYATLVSAYAELTEQQVTYTADTLMLLQQSKVNLDRSMTVPAAELQTVFEHLLRRGQFCLRILKPDGVRVLEVVSLQTHQRGTLRSSVRFIPEESIAQAGRHPALMFTTVVKLPNTDVRQLANSMRTMITDANTQQMLPAGNSNSIVLVGFGDSIVNLVKALHIIDEAAASGADTYKQLHEVVQLKNADAVEMAGLLGRVLRLDPEAPNRTQILADKRTNSLICSGTKAEVTNMKDLIASLDR